MIKRIRLLEQILLNVPNYVFWKDKNCIYRGCNKNFARSLGFDDVNEVIGKSDAQMPWDSASAQGYREEDFHIIRTGESIHNKEVQMTFESSKNDMRILLVSKVPLYDGTKVEGILGMYIDITKERQAEMAKNDFISNMEHDLRTPFAGIGGVAALLQAMYADKYPELAELFDILVNSCTQWELIHNRIFDVLETQQTLKIERFYIQDELDKIKHLMQATAHLKGLEFNVQYPPREETGEIESDVLLVNLIISNLVGNAFNFTPKGAVTIRAKKTKGSLIIEVKDTGIGIPEDKLDYIFEKFTKLAKSNAYGEVFKGLGLGLYSAREDAKKINGTITVKSKIGKGSVFSLILPLKLNASL